MANILKEAIADAKAVREVALANAKAALEEAFTPKLQSMLSAKLSETLNEEEDEDEDKEEVEESINIDEITGMEDEEEDEREDLDEEIDLEEILNELELEEVENPKQKTVDEVKDDELEEASNTPDKPVHRADSVSDVFNNAEDVHQGLKEDKAFDLDALLEEINNLDETEHEVEGEVKEWNLNSPGGKTRNTDVSDMMKSTMPGGENAAGSFDDWLAQNQAFSQEKDGHTHSPNDAWQRVAKSKFNEGMYETVHAELEETKAALEVKTTELNEVNLLNSKLLYVNRIFKANTLDDAQKLRVVETLDKADCIKEAKLIYETIKDTFTISKEKKTTPKRSIREGLGMASKATGTSTAPKKPILNESNDMVTRMQKLANITINQ